MVDKQPPAGDIKHALAAAFAGSRSVRDLV